MNRPPSRPAAPPSPAIRRIPRQTATDATDDRRRRAKRHRRHLRSAHGHSYHQVLASPYISCVPTPDKRAIRKIKKGKYVLFDKLLPPLDDGQVGQAAKKGTTRRQVSDLSSWMEAWNIFAATRIQTAPQTALEDLLVKYQNIICQLFAAYSTTAALKYDKLFRQAVARDKLHTLCWDILKEDILVWCVTHQPFRARQQPVPSRPTSTLLCLPAPPLQGVSTTRSEPPTMQARRSAGFSTSAGATREQSATLPTSAGSQAVVETTLPKPAHVLHHAVAHAVSSSELTPLYDALILSTNYVFTLTRPGLPGCLMASTMVTTTPQLVHLWRWCGSQKGWKVESHTSPLSTMADGHSVNDHINKEDFPVHYSSVDDAVALLSQYGQDALMAKIDLKAAFRLIPVQAADWVYLGICWRGQFYVDTCLPFGLRSAPALFNHYAEALDWIMANNYGAQLLHYLDDFLLGGPPGKDTCQEAMSRMLTVSN
ncbi:hypothetical protein EMCRGX_G021183 [Ephydatia muelleri]